MVASIENEVREIEVSKISPHPRNLDIFTAPTDAELQELADDMERNGQKVPIEVVDVGEDGDGSFVLVKGDRRLAAARLLEWTSIKAAIRTDTHDPLSAVVMTDLISDNLLRQQLDDLALARCYRALKKLERKKSWEGTATRDRLAERLGCGKSGRTLDRLEELLALPRDIQDMISRKQLSKSAGAKILKMDRDSRERFFKKVRSGYNPTRALAIFGLTNSTEAKSPIDVAEVLIRRVLRDLDYLRQHFDDIDSLLDCEDTVESLGYITDFFNDWNDRVGI